MATKATSVKVNPEKDNLSDMKLVVEDIKRHARDSYDEQDIIGEKELEMVDKIFASIPDRMTYCHGDNHCGNILIDSDDNPRYIDFPYSGYGHPIFDMYSAHMLFCGVTEEELNAPNKMMFFPRYLFNAEQCHKLWDTFIKGMTGTDDPAVLKMTEDKLTAYEFCIHIMRGLLYNKYTPDPEAAKKFWLEGSKRVMSEHIAKGNPELPW